MAEIQVSIINASTVLTDDQVRPVVNALQTQIHRDFYPPWGIDADLTFVPRGGQPAPRTLVARGHGRLGPGWSPRIPRCD